MFFFPNKLKVIQLRVGEMTPNADLGGYILIAKYWGKDASLLLIKSLYKIRDLALIKLACYTRMY